MEIKLIMNNTLKNHGNIVEFCQSGKVGTLSGADPGFGQGGPQLPRPEVANVVKRPPIGQGPGPT